MNLHLAEKVVIVSGGSAGIGLAIVQCLVQEGAYPVVLDQAPLPTELVQAWAEQNITYSYEQINLCDESACQAVIAKTFQKYGRIDGLVNNAGFNDNLGLNNSPSVFKLSLEKNLVHYYSLAHYCLEHLIATRGSIVNIASKTALTGQGQTSAYVASKGAQLSLTREWAAALCKQGVRVNAVIPAEVYTGHYQKWLANFANPEEKLKEIQSRIPYGGRLTTPEEIADTVVFLLSSRSSHTTGQWLVVDGGYTHLDRALHY